MRSTHRPLQQLHWWAILAVFFCGCSLRFVQMGHMRQTSLMTVIPRYLVLETEVAKTRKRRPGREPNEQELLSPLWIGCSHWKRNASKTPFRDFCIYLAESCCIERRGWNADSLASLEGLSNGCHTLLRIMKRTLAANVFRMVSGSDGQRAVGRNRNM